MNQIDQKFKELVVEISRKKKEEIFNKIKETYNNQHPDVKTALENYFKTFNYWGKLEERKGEYESLYLRASSLKDHIEDYVWLYNKLEDYRSKKLLYAILNNWYNFDTITAQTSLERNYGLGQYKKIYGYEITPESIELLKNNTRYYPNIEIRKKAVLETSRKVYMNINEEGPSANQIAEDGEEILEGVKIDDDIIEPISMIKMDIEGAEAKAIIGCQQQIKENTPKLLLSVYHNYEDLWKIPRMIDELNGNYKFYLRCYGTELFPTEIILYAIKKEV